MKKNRRYKVLVLSSGSELTARITGLLRAEADFEPIVSVVESLEDVRRCLKLRIYDSLIVDSSDLPAPVLNSVADLAQNNGRAGLIILAKDLADRCELALLEAGAQECFAYDNLNAAALRLAIIRAAARQRQVNNIVKEAAQIRESSLQSEIIAEAAMDSIFILNHRMEFEYINSFGAGLLGLKPPQVIGQNINKFLEGISCTPSLDQLGEMVREGQPFSSEVRIDYPQRVLQLHIKFTPVKEPAEEHYKVFGIARDLTEQKRAEESIAEERNRAQQYLDVAGVMLIALKADQTISLINRKGCRILDAEEKDILGKNFFDAFVPKEMREERRASFESLLQSGVLLRENYVGPIRTARGKKRIIAWQDSLITDEDGHIQGTFSSGEDITARLAAENEVRASREQLSFTVESARAGMWSFQFEPTRPLKMSDDIYLSPQMKNFIGYEPDEFPDSLEAWLQNMPPEDQRQFRKDLTDMVEGRSSGLEIVHRVRHRDGSYRWLLMRGDVKRDSKGEPVKWSGLAFDVTDRKQVEQDLFLSRQMLRLVMDAIPVSVFWKDTGLNYLGCNLQFAKDAGVSSPRDLIGRNDLSLVWRDHAERYRIDDLRVMQSGTPKLNYEEPSTGPDGKTFWVKTNKIPMRDSSGHITGVLGCYEDITERKQSEQELKQRADDMHLINTLNQANNRGEDLTRIAERLSWETRRIFLCNAVVIYLLNEDRTQLVLINTRVLPEDVRDGIENMFGFRPPERFNIPLREDSELWRLCFSAEPHLINEPESITSLLIEFTGGRKIRRLMPKLIEVMRIHSLIAVPLVSNREVIGALGVSRAEPFTDNELQRFSSIAEHLTAIITRKKVEEGLLIRNAALQASINAFAIFDIIGRITYVNDAFLKTWGFDRYTEILGRHAVIIWSDLEEGRIAIKELHERGRWGGEMRAARRSGSEFTALAQATVVRGEDGVPICFASSFIDITQRKDAAREMERLNAELEKKNKELEQIIYVTSHDLRTPLVNIQGFARELEYSLQDMAKVFEEENLSQSVLEKMEPILDKDIPLALGYINKSVAKMDSLLAGLLQLSRLGRAEFLMQPLDMNQLMVDVLASLEFQIEERNASLEIGDLPPCLGDQIQLNRVFSNLLDNAIKYLEPDRPGEVSLTGEVSGDRVVYQIKDNGIGIAERDIERIFEIFHQLNPVASQGEGLGLTIVQRILERHNGRIWVESHLGVGSVFYVSLPAAPST